MVRPHTRTPTARAATQEPFQRSVTRLLFSVTPFGRKPRERAPEQPLSSSALAATVPIEPAVRRRFGEPARTDGTFPGDGLATDGTLLQGPPPDPAGGALTGGRRAAWAGGGGTARAGAGRARSRAGGGTPRGGSRRRPAWPDAR